MSEILSFGQRYRKAKFDKFNLHGRGPQLEEEYGRLQESRNTFSAFCEQEGFSSITTVDGYNQKHSEIKRTMEEKPLGEAFDYLKQLQRHVLTGRRLTSETNLYLRAKTKAGKPPEQLTDEEIKGLGFQVEIASPWAVDENAYSTLAEEVDVAEASLTRRVGQSEDQYPQKEALFALHRETVIIERLLPDLADSLGANIGVNGDALLYSSRQTEQLARQAEHFSKPPEALTSLRERGLARFNIDDDRVGMTYLTHLAIDILLPDGMDDEDARSYIRSVQNRDRREQDHFYAFDQRNVIYERYLDARDEASDRKFLLQKKMYNNVVEIFDQVQELTYPHLEQKARELAAYVLSPETGGAIAFGVLRKDVGKPLAESVPLLKSLAYERGLDMTPLIDEMRREIEEKNMDPQQIADRLERTNNYVKRTRRAHGDRTIHLDKRRDNVDWFVEETFGGISALDKEGNLSRKESVRERHVTVKRHPQVVQQVIDALRSMPTY